MGLMIDTSVLIEVERGKIDFDKWSNYAEAFISSITVTELLVGVDRAKSDGIRMKRAALVEHILSNICVINFGIDEARIYARIINSLFIKNITIGAHDLIIGATAIAHGYALLTMNVKDFKRIEGLEVIDIKE